MANVNFTMSPAPGIIQDMIAVIYDSNAPAAELSRQTIPAPHTSPVNLSFTNLNPGTYIVKIHETPDGVTLGNLHHDFWVDASLQHLSAFTVKTFQVGAGRGTPYFDPADQDVDYINTDLNGLDYTVFKPGYGPLDWVANINPYIGGGFSLIDGQKFSQDEIYTILISNLVTQPLPPTTGKSYPDDVVVIANDTAFGSSHYNKLLEIDSANTLLTITIASLGTIPDGTMFGINTQKHNNVTRYTVLQLPGGTYCYVNGEQRNIIYLGKGEEIWLHKKGSVLRIIQWDGDYRRIGEKVWSDGKSPINGLALTGQWLLKTDYPRLFEWHVNALPMGELGTATQDTTPDADNITKWIIGPTKFWAPNYEELFMRGASGSRLAGSYEEDDNKAHNHVTAPWDKAGAKASDITSEATTGSLDSANASTEYRIGQMGSYWTAATIQSQGTEARPKNVAQNIYVII